MIIFDAKTENQRPAIGMANSDNDYAVIMSGFTHAHNQLGTVVTVLDLFSRFPYPRPALEASLRSTRPTLQLVSA